ncbi:MAG: hypothetical protein J5994_11325 [Ruminococcus sp.]|nr:hypothetical protein [Ruminococcus sp.]
MEVQTIVVLTAESIPEKYSEAVISSETIRKIIIVLGIVILVYMALSVLASRGKFNVLFRLGSGRKLEECRRKGLIVIGKVVGMETEDNVDLRLAQHDRAHRNTLAYKEKYSDYDDYVKYAVAYKTERLIKSIDDGRVSYKPVIEYKFGGKTYTESYYRYIDERKFRLKDGDSVRIICAEYDPSFYIIHGDTEAYRYLSRIIGIRKT